MRKIKIEPIHISESLIVGSVGMALVTYCLFLHYIWGILWGFAAILFGVVIAINELRPKPMPQTKKEQEQEDSQSSNTEAA